MNETTLLIVAGAAVLWLMGRSKSAAAAQQVARPAPSAQQIAAKGQATYSTGSAVAESFAQSVISLTKNIPGWVKYSSDVPAIPNTPDSVPLTNAQIDYVLAGSGVSQVDQNPTFKSAVVNPGDLANYSSSIKLPTDPMGIFASQSYFGGDQ